VRALDIWWEYHTPWHPPSSGKVERMNQTLERQLTELVFETRLTWTKCLPLALLKIKTAPQKDIRIFPYEMLYVLPIWAGPLASPPLKPNISFPKIMCSISLQLYHPSGNSDCWPRLQSSNFQCTHTDWEIASQSGLRLKRSLSHPGRDLIRCYSLPRWQYISLRKNGPTTK
jgi:hypothetical protein